MKIINESPRHYMYKETIIKSGATLELTDKETIEMLLKQDGVKEVVDMTDFKKLQEEKELAELKLKATKLGIEFHPNIKAETLKKKIKEKEDNKDKEKEDNKDKDYNSL